jgi:uncharacterized protein YbcI
MNLTKGQVEAKIAEAITKFELEQMGRGPKEKKAYIIGEMIVLQLKGVLTKAECKLAESEDGAELIKQIRTKLLEKARPVLEKMIEKIVSAKIVSMHSDISTRTGERIIVFTFDENLDSKFKK